MRLHPRECYTGVSDAPLTVPGDSLCFRARLGIVDLRRPVTPGCEVLPIIGEPHAAYDTRTRVSVVQHAIALAHLS